MCPVTRRPARSCKGHYVWFIRSETASRSSHRSTFIEFIIYDSTPAAPGFLQSQVRHDFLQLGFRPEGDLEGGLYAGLGKKKKKKNTLSIELAAINIVNTYRSSKLLEGFRISHYCFHDRYPSHPYNHLTCMNRNSGTAIRYVH